MIRLFTMLMVALSLAACSLQPGCLDDQPYMHAEPFPILQAPPGLEVPPPDPDMSIPEVASGPVGVYPADKSVADSPRGRCLAMPPRLPSRSG